MTTQSALISSLTAKLYPDKHHEVVSLSIDERMLLCDALQDKARMNRLQALTKGYGGGWILRDSRSGRGMRLHETSQDGAVRSIRQAIDNYPL